MQTIAEIRLANLERLIKEMGTQDRVAEFGGTSSVYLSQIRNSAPDSKTGKLRVMGDEMARKLEIGCSKPRGWMDNYRSNEEITSTALFTGYASDMPRYFVAEPQKKFEIDLQNNPAYPAVKRVKFTLSAGISGFGVEYDEGNSTPLVFNRSWYEGNGYTPANLFAVSVSNGSMEPGLHHGDVVIVNTDSTKPKDGKVFAANYEGEMVIKRLVRDAGQWWLSSDNADQRRYPRKICDENCQIIGEIVHKQSETI